MSPESALELSAAQEESLARYLSGELSPGQRAEFERACLENDRLFDAAYSDVALEGKVPLGKPPATGRGLLNFPRAIARRAWWVTGLSAAALVALALLRPGSVRPPSQEDVFRGGTPPPGLETPVGTVPHLPSRFVWNRMPGAFRYRLEVLDAEARMLHVAVTSDTALVLARGALPGTLTVARWRVVALDAQLGEIRGSAFATFRVMPR